MYTIFKHKTNNLDHETVIDNVKIHVDNLLGVKVDQMHSRKMSETFKYYTK